MTTKKKEKEFATQQEEITFLKKQNAGQKGQISLLQKMIEKLQSNVSSRDNVILSLNDKLNVCREVNDNLRLEIEELRNEICYFRSLPWWKRILYK